MKMSQKTLWLLLLKDLWKKLSVVCPSPALRPNSQLIPSLENVLAGNCMVRRATYMYGNSLTPSPTGLVDAGLGKTVQKGTISLIPPTHLITKTGQSLTIDGVEVCVSLPLLPTLGSQFGKNYFFCLGSISTYTRCRGTFRNECLFTSISSFMCC